MVPFPTMDNQPEKFQDSTYNLTNAETKLNSTQQDYIKAITKLVSDKKKPSRGPIPKISLKIPETQGKFILKWEGIQQETGLNLAQALREYWINRSHKLSEELDPIKNRAR